MNHYTIGTCRHAVTALALSALGGCAVLSSTPLDGTSAAVGQPYMLPKALLPVELVEVGGQISLRVLAPRLVGDPKAQYVLSRQSSPFARDDIKVDVADGMLSSIGATTDDKLLDALKALFTGAPKSDGKEDAGVDGAPERVLFRGDFDPDDTVDRASCADRGTTTQGNKLLLADISCAVQQRGKALQAACPATQQPPTEGCAAVRPLIDQLRSLPDSGPALTLSARAVGGKAGDARGSSVTTDPPAPCHIGICQRALRLFELRAEIGGLAVQQTLLPLPNGGQVVAMPIERVAFVKTEHTLAFSGGAVTSAKVVHGSSALALLAWPMDVYRAFIAATSEIIQLRIDTRKKEVEGAKSEVDTLKALLDLQKERDALATGKESARANQASLPPAGNGAATPPLPVVPAPAGAPAAKPGVPTSPAVPRPPALLRLTIG